VENAHDIFYEHDILVAINFLEPNEKETIIEKVLPRIKQVLNNVHSADGNIFNSHKLGIEKRLLEFDDDTERGNAPKKMNLNGDLNSSIELSDVNEDIGIEEDSHDDKINENDYDDGGDESEFENDAISVGETLAESMKLSQGTSGDEFTQCEICNQSVRKSILDFHRKSHNNTVECDICRKVMQKKSLYKHKKRCEIMSNISRNASAYEEEQDEVEPKEEPASFKDLEVHHSIFSNVNKTETPKSVNEFRCPICSKPMLKGNIRRHIRMVHGSADTDFKCKICSNAFPQLDTLKLHTYQEHNLDLEDVEKMLQEQVGSNEGTLHNEVKENGVLNEATQGNVHLDPQIVDKVMKSVEQDTHVDNEAKKFKCAECDNVYTSKDSLRRHRKKVHQ